MPTKSVREKLASGKTLNRTECLESRAQKARNDLLDSVQELEDNEDVILSAQPKLTNCPAFQLAAWESWYARFSEIEDEHLGPHRPLTGYFVSVLIRTGIAALDEDSGVAKYRATRERVQSSDTAPRIKTALREWVGKCSYKPTAPFGSTEHYYFRTWPDLFSRLVALSKELGLPYSVLGIVCWGYGLACQEVHSEERAAFLDNWDGLLSEVGIRAAELTRRFKSATGEPVT